MECGAGLQAGLLFIQAVGLWTIIRWMTLKLHKAYLDRKEQP